MKERKKGRKKERKKWKKGKKEVEKSKKKGGILEKKDGKRGKGTKIDIEIEEERNRSNRIFYETNCLFYL